MYPNFYFIFFFFFAIAYGKEYKIQVGVEKDNSINKN